jgi:hypothetical protein
MREKRGRKQTTDIEDRKGGRKSPMRAGNVEVYRWLQSLRTRTSTSRARYVGTGSTCMYALRLRQA